MIRGTRQEFRFKLPYTFEEVYTLQIMFWQENYNGPARDRPLPVVKVKAQCSSCADANQCSVILNQEETLRFTDKIKAKVQLRGATADGTSFATREHLITVYPVADDSILEGDIIPTPTHEDLAVLEGPSIS